jgi:hypothetical protein
LHNRQPRGGAMNVPFGGDGAKISEMPQFHSIVLKYQT